MYAHVICSVSAGNRLSHYTPACDLRCKQVAVTAITVVAASNQSVIGSVIAGNCCM
jgi:hypothetical protein